MGTDGGYRLLRFSLSQIHIDCPYCHINRHNEDHDRIARGVMALARDNGSATEDNGRVHDYIKHTTKGPSFQYLWITGRDTGEIREGLAEIGVLDFQEESEFHEPSAEEWMGLSPYHESRPRPKNGT